ncbi:hypothetical protein [Nocardioides sp. LML1-1-1.1]|uniref:hypothetical protein n=1 Tax=Nocardioides sp. LML1-1-1.1 TaxID=3135248 RepID=UPI00342F1402
MSNTTRQLRDDVRRLVVDHLSSRPEARTVLADALSVPPSSIDRMVTKDVWELSFALQTADALGMRLHVVRD